MIRGTPNGDPMAQLDSRHCLPAFFGSLPLLLALVVMVAPTTLHSQSAAATGRLEGTVIDSSGAAVSGADIAVRNQNTGISTTIASGSEGDFTVLYLEPGTYEVSIQKSGFNKLVLKDIAVTVGTRPIIHPQLPVLEGSKLPSR